MRSLYSVEYLESGCLMQFDDAYAVDNTMWTYVSAYAVSLMALLSGLLIYYADKGQSILMSSYFVLTGFGYLVAGASSQFSETKSDWQYTTLRPVALVITVISAACLMRSGLLYYFFSTSLFANIIWAVTNLTMIILSLVFQSYLIASIWMVVIFAGMAIVYFRQSTSELKVGREWLSLKILAMLATVMGFMIQYILEKTCGVSGYEDCFSKCSLADPTAFNNTAIKNVLVAAGILFLAIAEIFLPSHDFWESEFEEESFMEGSYDDEEASSIPSDNVANTFSQEDEGVPNTFSQEDSLNP